MGTFLLSWFWLYQWLLLFLAYRVILALHLHCLWCCVRTSEIFLTMRLFTTFMFQRGHFAVVSSCHVGIVSWLVIVLWVRSAKDFGCAGIGHGTGLRAQVLGDASARMGAWCAHDWVSRHFRARSASALNEQSQLYPDTRWAFSGFCILVVRSLRSASAQWSLKNVEKKGVPYFGTTH